jgi:tripartite-type tricarboxylate transporter receptor subunit TctC
VEPAAEHLVRIIGCAPGTGSRPRRCWRSSIFVHINLTIDYVYVNQSKSLVDIVGQSDHGYGGLVRLFERGSSVLNIVFYERAYMRGNFSFCLGLLAVAGIAMSGDAWSQTQLSVFPFKPITLVVPFPAGGPSDALARAVSQGMSVQLGQPIIIENLAGAAGTIGLTKVARSPKDGYTLGFGTIGTHVANVALYKKLPYDPVADFDPIGLAGIAPMILVTKSDFPANNLKDFVSFIQAQRPRKLTYGSAGVGSISHYGCVMLMSALKLEATHVPYRGVAPAMNDLMGGQIDFMCDQTTTALPQVAGGKIKAIAVLSRQKLAQLPKAAPASQSGYPDVDLRAWNALFAPKGTPAPVLKRLNEALAAATSDRQLRQQMQVLGVDLPTLETVSPGIVSAMIVLGQRREVPALKARGEYLD